MELTAGHVWTVVAAGLVFFMTPGLALFYGGMTRAKGVLNMMMMSFAALGVVGVVWVLWGGSMLAGDPVLGGLTADPFAHFGLHGLMGTEEMTDIGPACDDARAAGEQRLGDSDARVQVSAAATAGEASHPDSPTHAPEDLVRLRRAGHGARGHRGLGRPPDAEQLLEERLGRDRATERAEHGAGEEQAEAGRTHRVLRAGGAAGPVATLASGRSLARDRWRARGSAAVTPQSASTGGREPPFYPSRAFALRPLISLLICGEARD